MNGQSGISPEVVPLPDGGGAIRSIGESFEPDLHTGTGNYPIPLWFPVGAGKLRPEMSLTYSTGVGNGPFGMGWQLGMLTITRQTERGLPTYDDDEDTFLLNGTELVPVGGNRYRARVETAFFHVERIGEGWVVRDRGGRRFTLGDTTDSRVQQTENNITRIASWSVSRVTDTNGNEISYTYQRVQNQLYLASLAYSIYTVVFIYELRPDAFTNRRYGFDLTTTQRCTAITYQINGEAAPFQYYDLTYDECPYSRLSLLASVTLRGDRAGESVQLPPLHFTYTQFSPSRNYQAFRSDVDAPPPRALDDANYDLIDLYGNGLPGVIELSDTLKRYWPNRGNGRWGAVQALSDLPAPVALANEAVAFADMDGNGTPDLMVLSEQPLGYYRNQPGQGWTQRTRFRRAPQFDPRDGELRLLDLDGDNLVDVLRSSAEALYLYYNRGPDGWEQPVAIPRRRDRRRFPDVSLADPRVKLADMTGDGLIDIVYVYDGRIDYWPHYGKGRFGDRITLTIQPQIGRRFDPDRLFFSDVNGNGLSDMIYVERDRVYVWINQSGQALHPIPVIRHTPITQSNNVQLADMTGTGVAGLLWSYPRSRRDPHNYKYLAFSSGTRPYLLATIDNSQGLRTEISYSSSTDQALAAAEARQPWQTTLPFAVPTVAEIVQRDLVSQVAVTKRLRYFDGYFDGRERSFRGFGRVELIDVGDTETPSTRTVSYFHQGIQGITPGASVDERMSLTSRLYRLEVYDADDSAAPLRTEENDYTVRQLAMGSNGKAVLFPHLSASTVRVFERQTTPVVSTTQLIYDDFGNVIENREIWDSGSGQQTRISEMRYSVDPVSWLLNLPIERLQHDGSGTPLRLERFYYDGDPFVGLPLGQATTGNMRRHEQMVISDTQVTQVYGASPSDYAALGYHRMTAPDGTQGWAVHSARHNHDARGNITERQDALNNITQIIYDADGLYPIASRNPLNQVLQFTYDRHAGKLARVREPNGHETRYRYDPVGRLIAMIKPGDTDALPTVTLTHLDSTLPVGVRTQLRENANQTETLVQIDYFNGMQNVIQKRVAAENGQVLVDGWRQYSQRGWETERTSPFFSTGFAYIPNEGQNSAQRYHFTHDTLGRIVETITPDGRPSRIVYGPVAITRYDVSDTDDSPANIARNHFDTPRREHYDAKGNLLSVIEENIGGVPHRTHYTYDALSQLTAITDARNVLLATYTHDMIGRKISVQHVDAGQRLVVHNGQGEVALTVDSQGRRTAIQYDQLGRKREVRVDGTITERYTYDAGTGANVIGQLAWVEDEAGTVEFSYTPRGHIEEKTRTVSVLGGGTRTLTIAYTYDAMERMTSVTYPDTTTAVYHYNDRGLLARIEPNGTGLVDAITYDALGRVTQVDYASGVSDRFVFDAQTFYLLSARTDGLARIDPYYHVSYTYDAVGNPLTIDDLVNVTGHPQFQRQYTYDARYQLTATSGTLDGVAFNQQYRYDEAGNLQRNDAFRPDDLTLEPNTNRLRGAMVGGVETVLFQHDMNGNMVQMPDKTLHYDARSRLVRVEKSDGAVVVYTYGFAGERVSKQVTIGGITTETLYVDNLYEESGSETQLHIFNDKTRVATLHSSGARHVYHRDHIGNTVLVTDETGAIVQELGYFPYGALAYSVGSDVAGFRFMGDAFDAEVGLVYALARYYAPDIGRFVTPDLFTILNPERVLGIPLHLNPYAYAGNNPLRYVDDEGAFWKWLVGALVIAALVVATVVVGIVTGGAGFAFGILLVASIGSAFGSGIGVYSAATAGGDLADGFLFGTLVGGAAGAAGYLAGAAVGAAGISASWGAILSGAAQGAVLGAANGAIAGYTGGAGSIEDILTQAGIGFVVGAVVGGLLGYLTYSQPQVAGTTENAIGTGTAKGVNAYGQPISQTYETGLRNAGRALGGVWEPTTQSVINSLATPVGFNVGISIATGVAGFGHAAAYHDWDDIRAWVLEVTGEDEIIIGGSSQTAPSQA